MSSATAPSIPIDIEAQGQGVAPSGGGVASRKNGELCVWWGDGRPEEGDGVWEVLKRNSTEGVVDGSSGSGNKNQVVEIVEEGEDDGVGEGGESSGRKRLKKEGKEAKKRRLELREVTIESDVIEVSDGEEVKPQEERDIDVGNGNEAEKNYVGEDSKVDNMDSNANVADMNTHESIQYEPNEDIDRAMALSLARGDVIGAWTAASANSVINVEGISEEKQRDAKVTCPVCFDDFPRSLVVEGFGNCTCEVCWVCSHHYVAGKVKEKVWPIKCAVCKEMATAASCSLILAGAGPTEYQALQDLITEKEHAKDMKYCSNEECGVGFSFEDNPEMEDKEERWFVTCPACKKETCVKCHSTSHPGGPCNMSEEDRVLASLAKKKNWTKCPSCHTFVEKISGCNHVSCRCGTGFCFGCGKLYNESGSNRRNVHGTPSCQCGLYTNRIQNVRRLRNVRRNQDLAFADIPREMQRLQFRTAQLNRVDERWRSSERGSRRSRASQGGRQAQISEVLRVRRRDSQEGRQAQISEVLRVRRNALALRQQYRDVRLFAERNAGELG